MVKLSELTNGRNNNLNALRLLAALLVVTFHIALEDIPVPFYSRSWGLMAVNAFFVISGFLITQSYVQSNNPVRYAWARVLRIFPALIIVVLATAFIIGPLLTNLSPGDYFKNIGTYAYLKNITLYGFTTALPGVDQLINNPLWTLRYEFTCYLLVLLLGLGGLLTRNKFIPIGLFTTSLVLNYFHVGVTVVLWEMRVADLIIFIMYFSAGMAAYLYREYIPIHRNIFLFVGVLLLIGFFKWGYDDFIFVFLLTYIILFIGFSIKDVNLAWLTKWGDFSYGIYIWGYPIQNLAMYYLGKETNPLWIFLVTVPITYIIGALSWHLIEKRALSLKNRFPFLLKKPGQWLANPALN